MLLKNNIILFTEGHSKQQGFREILELHLNGFPASEGAEVNDLEISLWQPWQELFELSKH